MFHSYAPPPFQVSSSSIDPSIVPVDTSALTTLYAHVSSLNFQDVVLSLTDTNTLTGGNYRVSTVKTAPIVFDFENDESSIFVLYFPEPITIVNNSTVVNGGSYKNIVWISPEIVLGQGTSNVGVFLSNRIVNLGATVEGQLIATEELVFSNSVSSFANRETNFVIYREVIEEKEEPMQNTFFRLQSSTPLTLQSPSVSQTLSSVWEPDYRPNKFFPFCMNPCQPAVILPPQNSSGNNSTISKAMRYSQYVRNSQNKKTMFL
jgi:hypothetical protein